jgi:cytokinin riboside 5'-monophosphate phosphoribohydrolase
LSVQEYDAAVQDEEDAATPKLRWEIEQVGYNSTLQAEIAR